MAAVKEQLLVLMVSAVLASVVTTVSSPPHIILIVADDLGWNDVSWHNPLVQTPHLEALARSGVQLEQSYVLPLCTPTRSALLSGRYPFTIGRQHLVIWPLSPSGLDPDLTILPQTLKSAGYSTHIVGKWHLGFCSWQYTPTLRGFDTFYGYYQGAEYYYSHIVPPHLYEDLMCNDKKMSYGYDFRRNTDVEVTDNSTYSPFLFSSYVEQLLSSRNPEDPMFLYLPFQSVHFPLEVPEEYTEPYSFVKDENRTIVLGMISAMDEAVGRVVDALRTTGHYDNSVIVFTTDNGGPTTWAGNNWPLRGNKSSLFEGGTRGVAFVHSPLLPNPGTVSHQLIHVTDWYQTLAGLAGAEAPTDTDGVDQWPTITGSVPSPRTDMIYNIDNTTKFSAAVRMGEFKLLVGDPGWGEWTPPPENDTNIIVQESNHINTDNHKMLDDGQERIQHLLHLLNANDTQLRLYDLTEDPEERVNLAEIMEELVIDMLEFLEQQMSRYVPADYQPCDLAGDPINFDNVWTPGWC
ncbi:arylsulfatase B [Cherax quadricarinatus]